eukprot:CAMPEP_0172723736 /NCGR_PEP_ID=MMETSP1074-20121228/84364_1 /TAXON_ID=2916 /ORGANISM="Ceratium fusus, Strain PA161109" /LENGTH=57 /DNA_ID=CAMNT_0013550031 /DNA_START=393 /DNA_END=563 /DNA_ORIENTATION=-
MTGSAFSCLVKNYTRWGKTSTTSANGSSNGAIRAAASTIQACDAASNTMQANDPTPT